MAEYEVQQGRLPPRPNNYGHGSTHQRDAAFSNIFGAPPPGRSQTMTSQPSQTSPERTQTMPTQASAVPQFVPSTAARPPPVRVQQNGYGLSMANGYYQRQRQPNGVVQQHPSSQFLPQPLNPERRPFPQPQRIDSRQSPYQQYGQSNSGRGPPLPNPALNTDSFRSRSMATMSSQPIYTPPQNSYNQASDNSFRQPHHPLGSRTTAQGRIVPERHDERTMSLTSWSSGGDHNQTMSGRIIPNRKRESGPEISSNDHEPGREYYGLPVPGGGEGGSASMVTTGSRTMSMATTVVPSSERSDSLQHRPSVARSIVSAQTRTPLVYPALLSRVAIVFSERINPGDRNKNQLSYKFAFTGSEAVDLFSYIIKTTDRNLALLLGRALDAQKFFHDVTYEHRLRDSPVELYQFREALIEEPSVNVNGVFTLLTECYSPTCTRDSLCYSIACPRRLEQQSRLNLKPQPGLRRETSTASLHGNDNDEQKLWINTVTKEVADSVDEKERKRQEVISEIMYTERDFVKDLEYLRDFWIKPLRSNNPNHPQYIPQHKQETFISKVFSNIMDVHNVNSKFAEALTRRQQQNPVVRNVGDIFLRFVPEFEPFVKYGGSQLNGKYEFERERATNAVFSRFVDETERMKESRKLELNGYLTKPTTRLARYPLLLDNVLKYTADENPDKKDIPEAITGIKNFLSKVNIESGKAENAHNLLQLGESLKFPPGEPVVDLKLDDANRELIFKGNLKKSPTDSSEIMVHLFDHAVLLAKQKFVNKREEIRVYKRPIPLELLVVLQMDEVIPKLGVTKRPSSSLALGARNAVMPSKVNTNSKDGFPITFRHLGKPPFEVTLYATTHVQRRKWLEHIEACQTKLRERTDIFARSVICEGFFGATNRVKCLVPLDGAMKLVYGTDNGVYVSDRQTKGTGTNRRPRKVLDITSVTQLDVLEEYQLLLVLSNKNLLSYSLEVLDANESQSPLLKRPKKIQGHANFFKAGVCMGRYLVCTAKTSSLSTTIKVFEPLDTLSKGKKKPGITQLFQGGQDALKPYKELYIPTESSSIHFLKSKLCVACARGFEVVSLETLETQSLLDLADTSLDFVARDKAATPIHIERVLGDFLLNYSEFSFKVDRWGWQLRPEKAHYMKKIIWEGQPTDFAIQQSYIVAFEPNFIEIRNMDTNSLNILAEKNIRFLHSSTREVLFAYEDENGEDVIASLDFWSESKYRPDPPWQPSS